MTHSFLRFCSVLAVAGSLFTHAQSSSADHSPIMLPTSKMLETPVPGRIGSTNSFPVTMVVSPDGKYAALLNDGFGTQETLGQQSISIFNLATNQIAEYPDQRFGGDAHQSYFIGLAFSSDGKQLYASVGSLTDPTGERPGDLGNGIAVYRFAAGKVVPEKFVSIPLQPLSTGRHLAIGLKAPPHMAIPYPAGITVLADGRHDKLLVANNLSDNVVLLDPATGKVLHTFDLSTDNLVPSSFPYTCVATKDNRRAWCSLWNGAGVAELDLTAGTVGPLGEERPENPLAPGSHPTAMQLSGDERILYLARANADAVDVVPVSSPGSGGTRFSTRLPGQEKPGSYPTALALTPDGKHLFVADSALNAVAVYGLGNARLEGFIPTDWYPSAIAVHGDDLLIASAKGQGAGPNKEMGKIPSELRRHRHIYLPTLLRGSIARLNIPSTLKQLPQLTETAERDNLVHSDPGTIAFRGGKNPIKHVIYVIKENRTYDQILGDLKVGNGDPSLTMYGEDITPNEHRLARQFGVLDNFYDSGEVSGDGHLWSTAAITSDYNEKTWQIAYRGKERTYDFQGQVADEYPLEHNQPDIDDPATGFLWDNLARNHVSFRDYGEFVNAEWCNRTTEVENPQQGTPSNQESECPRTVLHQGDTMPPNVGDPHGAASPWPWDVPLFSGVKPTKAILRDHFDPLYPDFNTDYPDQLRADEFLNEFGAYVRARQSNEGPDFEMPSFVLLYLPDDHTGGTRPDRARPAANVADNDLALGRVVDAVSHSPYWDDTAIFVLEDDAQDGADHVDAHRSIAFVISKYSPGSAAEPNVEHRFYTTVNMVHTMEALLNLPPMNQFDAYAPLLAGLFSGPGDQAPYKADYRNLKNGLIYERNRHDSPGAKLSLRMDFSRPDAAPAQRLNRVLWQDQKGSTPMPAPRHTVFPSDAD